MRVFLFDWDHESARRHAAALEAHGIEIGTESADGARGAKAVLKNPPDAVLFSLEKRPSHSRETAAAIRGCKAGRQIPLLFFGGKPADAGKVRARVPDAAFTSADRLLEALRAVMGRSEA